MFSTTPLSRRPPGSPDLASDRFTIRDHDVEVIENESLLLRSPFHRAMPSGMCKPKDKKIKVDGNVFLFGVLWGKGAQTIKP